MIWPTCLRVALALACFGGATFAQCAEHDAGTISSPGQPELLGDDQLSGQRAGFSWQGLQIQFGAEIRTYLGDELVMLTNVNWTDSASEVQRTVSDALTPVAPDHSDTILGNGLNIRAGRQSVFLANQGQTAFIQRTDGVIQNIIANVASNVDIRQQVDVKLDLANFVPFQDNIRAARISAALSAMSGFELVRATPN